MLWLKDLRDSPEKFRESLMRRNLLQKVKLVDLALELDSKNRPLLQELQALNEKRNVLSSQVESLKMQKKPFEKVLLEAKKIPAKIKSVEASQKKTEAELEKCLYGFPNVLHESVPDGAGESDNVVIRSFLSPALPSFELVHHGALAVRLGCADFDRAVKVSGSGFFFLKNELALMEQALQQLAIKLLLEKGFSLISVPFMLRRKPYEGVTDFSDFENVMYKIDGEDLYLIATSEHAIAAMHSGEIMLESVFPLKVCGVSACFRKEVGKHGLDERGFFRVHQFNKVEQFVFCRPAESWKILEELVSNSESFLKKLEIPFQVTNVCTGDIGFVAAKKYDINGWSPREKKFIELMSISNCTDYQSQRLGIKLRRNDGSKEFVHTLNGTMAATSRLLRLIIEHYQTKEGTLRVPKALQPFMGGLKEIKPKKK